MTNISFFAVLYGRGGGGAVYYLSIALKLQFVGCIFQYGFVNLMVYTIILLQMMQGECG